MDKDYTVMGWEHTDAKWCNKADRSKYVTATPRNRAGMIRLPRALLAAARAVNAETENGLFAYDPEMTEPLRNRLGPDFGSIIKAPRALSRAEQAVYESLQRDNPAWFAVIASLSEDQSELTTATAHRTFAFDLLPLIGKYAAIEAAYRLGKGDKTRALACATHALEILRAIQDEDPDWLLYEDGQRINEELERILSACSRFAE